MTVAAARRCAAVRCGGAAAVTEKVKKDPIWSGRLDSAVTCVRSRSGQRACNKSESYEPEDSLSPDSVMANRELTPSAAASTLNNPGPGVIWHRCTILVHVQRLP